MISVCILTTTRTDALDACLDSLADQDDSPAFEVLVAQNGNGPTPVRTDLPLRAIRLPELPLGAARNRLVDIARGDMLVFLDDDTTVPQHFLADLARLASEHRGASVFGGPNLTPADARPIEVLQGEVLGSWAAGPYRRRYRPGPTRFVRDDTGLTLCNLAVRATAFQGFDESLDGAEENRLLDALFERGEHAVWSTDLTCWHHRRPTHASFAVQIHKYGAGRGQLLGSDPALPRWQLVAASAFVMSSAALAAILAPLVVACTLLACLALASVGVVGPTRLVDAPRVAPLLVILHVAYFIGLAHGITRRPATSPARPAPEGLAASAP